MKKLNYRFKVIDKGRIKNKVHSEPNVLVPEENGIMYGRCMNNVWPMYEQVNKLENIRKGENKNVCKVP